MHEIFQMMGKQNSFSKPTTSSVYPRPVELMVNLDYAHVVGSGAPLEEKEEKEHVPRKVLAMWFQVCFVDLLFSQFWNSAAFVSRRILHCYVVAMLPEGNAT